MSFRGDENAEYLNFTLQQLAAYIALQEGHTDGHCKVFVETEGVDQPYVHYMFKRRKNEDK